MEISPPQYNSNDSSFCGFPILTWKILQSHILNELFHIKSFQHFKCRWIKLFGVPSAMSSKDGNLSRKLNWISIFQKAVKEQPPSNLVMYLKQSCEIHRFNLGCQMWLTIVHLWLQMHWHLCYRTFLDAADELLIWIEIQVHKVPLLILYVVSLNKLELMSVFHIILISIEIVVDSFTY